MNNAEEIKDFIASQVIPVMGIAAASPLPSIPASFSPSNVLRDARSVICYGMPVPRGILHADNDGLALYWRYCNMLYRSLDITSSRLCVLLEEHGHRASPIYGCYPWKAQEREFWGLVPLVPWGEQAGLGRISRCGLLANSRYGTRLLLGGVITNMELEPTVKSGDNPCPADCTAGIDACPVNAIGKTGQVDHSACLRFSGANPLLSHLLRDSSTREKFSTETLFNTVAVDDHGIYTCFQCVTACPLNE